MLGTPPPDMDPERRDYFGWALLLAAVGLVIVALLTGCGLVVGPTPAACEPDRVKAMTMDRQPKRCVVVLFDNRPDLIEEAKRDGWPYVVQPFQIPTGEPRRWAKQRSKRRRRAHRRS